MSNTRIHYIYIFCSILLDLVNALNNTTQIDEYNKKALNIEFIYDQCEACSQIISTDRNGYLAEHGSCGGSGFMSLTMINILRMKVVIMDYYVINELGTEIYESDDLFCCLTQMRLPKKPNFKVLRRSDNKTLAYTTAAKLDINPEFFNR